MGKGKIPENSCEPLRRAGARPPGRMKKRGARQRFHFIGMAGVVQMELIDMARVPGRYFS
jgi:hypothetical protein